jgi:hypothetical protein
MFMKLWSLNEDRHSATKYVIYQPTPCCVFRRASALCLAITKNVSQSSRMLAGSWHDIFRAVPRWCARAAKRDLLPWQIWLWLIQSRPRVLTSLR